jgi:hypothetical protein
MKNNGKFETRKETARREFEEHFYPSWNGVLETASYSYLKALNDDKLKDINAAYPETMLWLKHMVLSKMAEFEHKDKVA